MATVTGYPGSFRKMDLEHKAIERIKMASEMSLHHYGQPLVCTYSGGKDSMEDHTARGSGLAHIHYINILARSRKCIQNVVTDIQVK